MCGVFGCRSGPGEICECALSDYTDSTRNIHARRPDAADKFNRGTESFDIDKIPSRFPHFGGSKLQFSTGPEFVERRKIAPARIQCSKLNAPEVRDRY